MKLFVHLRCCGSVKCGGADDRDGRRSGDGKEGGGSG